LTLFVYSPDGTRIAYDCIGTGPVLMLLHGLGTERRDWHRHGYVERLKDAYTVITVDLRGAGDSDHPQEIEAYSITKLTADVLAVADACGAERFAIWGYSLGGNLARYLGAWSARPHAAAVIGVPFGPAVPPALDRYITEFEEKWKPVVEAALGKPAGAKEKPKSKIKGNIPVYLACFQAMRTWPDLEASAVNCPTLLLVGTKNKDPYAWVRANRPALEAAGVQVEIIQGLNHPQELTKIDQVFPVVRAFFDQHYV